MVMAMSFESYRFQRAFEAGGEGKGSVILLFHDWSGPPLHEKTKRRADGG